MNIPTEDELNQLLNATFTNKFRNGYITEKGFILPERYLEMKKEIEEFEVYDSDVWTCGFPKTGTTWISEISWLLAHDLDYEAAKEVDYKRTRMLEFSMLFDVKKGVQFGGEHYEMDSIGHAKAQQSPRTIKSHLPYPLLPKQIVNGTRKPKIIYTARNPMDTCISYYHQCKNFENFTGTVDDFCKLFLYDKVNYGPYPSHVLSFWEQRDQPNVLFFTYEEMKKDIREVIRKVADLLGKSVSEEDITRLQNHVSFDSMKTNPAVNKEFLITKLETTKNVKLTPFIRAGRAGGYKNVMSPEIVSTFHTLMDEKFRGSGINILD